MLRTIIIQSALVLTLLAGSTGVANTPVAETLGKIATIEALIRSEIRHSSTLPTWQMARQIVGLSRQYRLDPLLVLAIIKVESQFNPRAISSVGAIGLMQVMPIVVREVKGQINLSGRPDLYDPAKNVHIGMHYFKYLVERFGDIKKALIAYNLGPTALDKRLSGNGFIPQGYYQKVMKFYRGFKDQYKTNISLV